MGNKKNRAKKNKRLANNWRKIIRTRKLNKHKAETQKPNVDINNENFMNSTFSDDILNAYCAENKLSVKTNKQDDCSEQKVDGTLEGTHATQSDSDDNESDGQIRYVLQKLDPEQHTVIIRGNFHQGDERFREFSRDKQCVAVSVVALCFFKISDDPSTWKTIDINRIVIYGDAQYNASHKKLKREGRTQRTDHLLLAEVYPYCKFDRKFYHLNGLDAIDADASRLESNDLKLDNLIVSLNRFFNEERNQCGIFTFNDYSFAIMCKTGSYFVFNSHATSYTGEPAKLDHQDSAACLTQMFTITCLANYLFVACDQGRIRQTSVANKIVFYLITNINIEKKTFGNDVSARQKVTRDLSTTDSKKMASCPKRNNSNRLYEHMSPKRQCFGTETECTNKQSEQCEVPPQKTQPNNSDQKLQNLVSIGCGLKNIGNSCFFNACLQALMHIPIINIFLQETKEKCACVICCLFQQTHSQEALFDPTIVYNIFRKQNNEDILNLQQQDAQEFWIRLMNLIDCEVNSCTKFNNWFEHDIEISVQCENCNRASITKETFSSHVIEIRGKYSIQEAVNAYFGEQTVKSYKCNNCEVTGHAKKKFFLKYSPKCMCLALSRFESINAKINQNLTMKEQLILSKYNSENGPVEVRYKLVSVINHIGGNLLQGHYTANSFKGRNFINEFDDSYVRKVDAISGRNAYMLIYEIDEQSADVVTTNDSFTNVIVPGDTITTLESIEQECESEYKIPSNVFSQKELIFPSENAETQCKEIEMLAGRRIVDIRYFFEQMQTLGKHSEDCHSRMEFMKEIKLGLRSIFKFHCKNCDIWYSIESCAKDDVRMSLNENDEWIHVNEAATLGMTATGLGFYHLEEFCANLDIPCMSAKTFTIEDKKLQKLWWELAKMKASEALQEEIILAKEQGSVDSKGNALIPAEIDGSWSKRAYGKGYSSLSGFASIIGIRTRKVVYFDVKNKYCHVCKLSYAKTCPPNQHDCNINYEGPSTGMEATIIVEGFWACEKFGARFHQYVGDGDANTFKELREAGIYKDPEVDIDKLECENHLFRNARSKIDDLSEATEFKSAVRKLLPVSLGDSICKGIRSAAIHWRQAKVNEIEKLENLERDCLNAPLHYFGNHNHCQEYFCQKSTTPESKEIVDLLKADGLFYAILNYCNVYFASNAKSLLAGLNNNDSEALNNVIAKNTGGKRPNYVLAGSYKSRCATAVVQWNCKGRAASTFHKFRNKNLGKLCYKIESKRIAKCARNAAARLDNPRKRILKVAKSNKSYGPNCGKPDLPERSLETAKQAELARLDEDRRNRDVILTQTYGQRLNTRWYTVRKKLINSTYFHRIVNAQSPKSFKNLLCEMMYSPVDLGKTAEVRHQRLYELEALNCFSVIHHDHNLEKTGLYIDKDISFLGASPLRLYGEESVVLVKCPVKGFKKTIDEAIRANLLPYWKHNNGNVSVNPKGSWYIEMQGMLHVTGKKIGFLVVWLGSKQVKIEQIARDDKFWEEEMKQKLVFFYKEAMIKEVVDSRRSRKMDLREFNSELKTFM